MALAIEVEEMTVQLDGGGFVIVGGIVGEVDTGDGNVTLTKVASTVVCDNTGLIVATWVDADLSGPEWLEVCDGYVTDPIDNALCAEADTWKYDSFLDAYVK